VTSFASKSVTMQKTFLLSFVLLVSLVHPSTAQNVEKLTSLESKSMKVYYSTGHQQKASSITTRVEKAIAFHSKLVGFKPTVTLLVLSAADWSSYTKFPVYGMPHYNDEQTLIVAAEDNPMWKSFIPPMDQLPTELRKQIETVYRNADGNISMEAFFDLLALHELGHAFHIQGGLTMQRKWMGELFCNILLHTYIAENEPEQLPALTLFPRMVINSGTKEFKYTSLQDVQERYAEIGQFHGKNYGWYQSRWHKSAGDIYDAGGIELVVKLWNTFKQQKEIVTDEQLISLMETSVHKSVADMIRNWERDTIR
jgi:hypothetical protein